MSRFRTFLIAAGVAVLAVAGISLAWDAIGGGPLPIHGLIALSLGVAGTIAMAWSLMSLAFRSSREGWDDPADRPADADVEPPEKP